MDLDDQFTGRRNDQGPGRAGANLRSSALERGQHGQGDCGLAGTGLGNAGHALPSMITGIAPIEWESVRVPGHLDGP